jgi:hypothetical protein
MARVPIWGAGLEGKSVNVSAQSRVNFYAEVQSVEDKARVVFYGTPGLDLFTDFGDTPVRGMLEVGDFAYIVHRGVFWEVDNSGTQTSRGTLNTVSGRVDMRYNGSQIIVVDGTNGYTYTISSTTFAQISDGDFLNGAATCAWQDGYAIVAEDREFAISTIDNATAWDATERADAEANPDPIVRVFELGGQVLLFGPKTIESWANTGALDFPYQRVGGGVINWGLAARWSLASFEGSVAGLFQNNSGDVQIGVLNGYEIQPLSNPQLDYQINQYSSVSDATGLAYRHSGHAFYQINFPAAGKSWVYDATSGFWSELKSNNGRHKGEIAQVYLNRVLISDYDTGRVYRLNPETYTENGETIEGQLISRHLYGEEYFPISRLWVDVESGVGNSGQGENPIYMLTISKDGGHTYGNDLFAEAGKLGKYRTRVMYRRLGRSRDWVFKLRITDPVKRVVMGEGWT